MIKTYSQYSYNQNVLYSSKTYFVIAKEKMYLAFQGSLNEFNLLKFT